MAGSGFSYQTLGCNAKRPGNPTAEVTGLNPVKCRFESYPGHQSFTRIRKGVNTLGSRHVQGYVKAIMRRDKLQARLQAKLDKLEPLRRKVTAANVLAEARYSRMNGTQIAEANRILKREAV